MPAYSFEDLEVYRAAREFRKKIFALTKRLPSEQQYDLKPQMRSAARSLTNNIAEGHGRYHYQDNIRFLRQSRGSLEELIDDLNICIDENYFAEDEMNALKHEAYELLRRINGYVAYLRKRKETESTN